MNQQNRREMVLDTAQHKTILIRLLKDIFTDTNVGPYLGFKGGTAAFLFYGLSRFSVDLDFDLLDKTKEDLVFEHMQNILKDFGLIKETRNKRYSIFFLLSYHNKLKDAQNIKIEINKRDFGSKYEIKQYLSIDMKVMISEDMAANKLVALYERKGKTHRDIFDVWFFLHNNWPINKGIIESRAKMSFKEFLKKCIALLEKINNKNILSGIGELLDHKQKIWAKAHLKSETIFLLNLLLSNQ